MVNKKYNPEKGDLVWVNFDPIKGHEQGGKRPALVISNDYYNKNSSLLLACPITSKDNKFPFNLEVKTKKIKGYVLVNHIKSIDYKARKVKKIDKISKKSLAEVLELIKLILE